MRLIQTMQFTIRENQQVMEELKNIIEDNRLPEDTITSMKAELKHRQELQTDYKTILNKLK
jgi:hypothetical protein